MLRSVIAIGAQQFIQGGILEMKTNSKTIDGISKSKRKIDMRSVLAAALAFAIALPAIGNTPPIARAQVQPPLADFGDAPDSGSNHAGVATNTAYPGVPGNFPTVWDGTNGFGAAGPRHNNPTRIFLGDSSTGETDADLAPDDDGVLNILHGGLDNSDNDLGDDGWRNKKVALKNCTVVPLKVRISRDAAPPPADVMLLNVWFDGNRDGDWADDGVCPLIDPLDPLDPVVPPVFIDGLAAQPEREVVPLKRYEWIVQNQPIPVGGIPAGGHFDFTIYTKRVMNTTENQPHWLRFSLTGIPAITPSIVLSGSVALPDGRGLNPPNAFQFGETEDYKQDFGEPNNPGTLVINKTLLVAPAIPRDGAAATYSINLHHVGGTDSAITTLKDRLPSDVSIAGPLSLNVFTGTVEPLTPTINDGVVNWTGELSPGARMRIVVPVRINPCVGANKTITNTARAFNTDGNVISDSVVINNIACSQPPNVDVKKEVIRVTDVLTGPATTDQHVLTDDSLIFRITARNNGAEPVVVFVRDVMPDGIRSSDAISGVVKRRIQVGPGLTGTLDIPAHVTAQCDIGRVITNVATYTAVPGTLIGTSEFNLPPTLPKGQTNVVTMRVHCHDLGDAPDSTNHFGANMAAYPGVQANFPTVFDAATGADQGPLHRNPHPFHLGKQFSIEAEADVGPDQDGVRNIVPPANNPDNDLKDDGVRVGRIVFSDCATTTIPVQVFIGPNAAEFFTKHVGSSTGYLNVWVDGNRDGDWADVRQCPTGKDGNRPAFEHIVIDHVVSLGALGAGLHVINVPTRLVPWPLADSNKPAWLRFTLSEAPSNKTLVLNDFKYGDGRGIAPPFVTGETEDYLWRPDPVVDVAIRKRGAMRTDAGGPITTTSANDMVVWQIDYANLGTQDASNVVITDDWTQGGNGAGLNITAIPPVSYTTSGKITTFNVGNLAAGAGGKIMIELARNYANFIYTNTATITATSDSDASNNSAIAEVKHKFIQPPIILNPLDGTTCDGDFTGANAMLGITTEGATVDVYVDGALATTLTAGGAGYFRPEMALPDGEHTIYAVAKLNGHEAVGEERRIIVNSALTFDPLSIRFKLEGGGAYRPTDDDGRTDETGWSVHLFPSRNYTASVRLCCESPTAQVTFDVGGTTLILTDPDGDHVYEAAFVSPPSGTTVTSTLSVSCNGSEIETQSEVLIDPDGVVYDINTGAPLSAAQAVCMVQGKGIEGATDGSAVSNNYSVWPAVNFGQLNPQTTKSDGYFSFFTPAGTYRLDVNKSGYQSYRSPDLQVVSAPVRHDVPLTPNIIEKPKVTITISENGFEPAMVRVAPGTAIAFVNADTRDHSAQGKLKSSTQAIETGGFNSGMLGPNQSHVVKLSAVGAYLYNDSANPEASGVIVVEGAIGHRVFLPLVRK
jgi:plastocyanin